MTENYEFDIGVSICNKENTDLTYEIVEKKYMNGILHYLLDSKTSTSSIYLSDYAVRERFSVIKNEPSNISKPSVSNLYSKITKSFNKEG